MSPLRWVLLIIISCLYNFQPSQPFLVQIFTEKNFTLEQVYNDIFPVWTYSFCLFLLLQSILVFYMSYKPLILLAIVCNVVSNLLLLLYDDYIAMVISEVCSGFVFSGYVIFTSFVYNMVKTESYQLISSVVKGCYLIGTLTSSMIGQLLFSLGFPLKYLLYLSASSPIFLFFICLFIPDISKNGQSIKIYFKKIKIFYMNKKILSYSLWSIIPYSIHHLVFTYWQSLFASVDHSVNWNGIVYGIAYGLGFVASFLPVALENFMFKNTWFPDLMLVVLPLISGSILVIMGISRQIYMLYVLLVLFQITIESVMPYISSVIATEIQKSEKETSKKFGTIFSINSLLGVTLQSIFQALISQFRAGISFRFFLFGIPLLVLSIIALNTITINFVLRKNFHTVPGLPHEKLENKSI